MDGRTTSAFMRLIAATSCLSLTAAQAQIHEVPVNSTLIRDGVRATLQKLVITGAKDRANVTAVFRVTDAAGHPLTIVRNARIALIEAHAASQPTYSENHPATADRPDSANVYATIIALRAQALRRVRTLSLDLQAARVTPTKVWANVPVRAGKTDSPGVDAYSDRAVSAQVTGVYRGTISSPVGRQTTPVVTVEVTEKTRGKRLPAPLPGGVQRGLV